jgi:hypothetical protein
MKRMRVDLRIYTSRSPRLRPLAQTASRTRTDWPSRFCPTQSPGPRATFSLPAPRRNPELRAGAILPFTAVRGSSGESRVHARPTCNRLQDAKEKIRTEYQYAGPTDYRHALTEGQISHSGEPAIVIRKFLICVVHGTSPRYERTCRINFCNMRVVPRLRGRLL